MADDNAPAAALDAVHEHLGEDGKLTRDEHDTHGLAKLEAAHALTGEALGHWHARQAAGEAGARAEELSPDASTGGDAHAPVVITPPHPGFADGSANARTAAAMRSARTG